MVVALAFGVVAEGALVVDGTVFVVVAGAVALVGSSGSRMNWSDTNPTRSNPPRTMINMSKGRLGWRTDRVSWV